MGDKENVLCHIFLHDEPRAAAEAEALTLADGVEPQSAVLTDDAASLQFHNVARLLAEVAAYVFVIIDIAEEADALRVLALGVDEVLALGYLPHLVLLVVAYGEEGLLQLPLVNLREEVGLVLYRVGAGGEPFVSVYPLGLRIVAGCDEVVVVPHLLVEGAELDKAVAHHVGVGGIASLDFFHGVAGHLAPVFLVAVDDL